MFFHRKELIQPVNVGTPDARFGTYLLEQDRRSHWRIENGPEHPVQSFHVENAEIRNIPGHRD